MSASKIPAWVPQWKDVGAYTKHTNPDDEWFMKIMIWEFLRRNSEYQSDYKRFADLPDSRPGGGQTAKFSDEEPMFTDDMSFRYCNPPALPEENWGQWRARVGDNIIEDEPLVIHLMKKWCIACMADPERDDSYAEINAGMEKPPYELQIEKVIDVAGFATPRPSPDEPEHVTLRFDLRYSIDEQLEKAREIISSQMAHLKNGPVPYPLDNFQSKDHTRKLLVYLRAFDASLAGATVLEIGKTLFPEKSDLDQMIQAAWRAIKKGREYVDGRYKNLIQLEIRTAK